MSSLPEHEYKVTAALDIGTSGQSIFATVLDDSGETDPSIVQVQFSAEDGDVEKSPSAVLLSADFEQCLAV
ncbi:MAG: hypothetical protein MHM6MM_008540, partial [Cercozoa sp. M6MM]